MIKSLITCQCNHHFGKSISQPAGFFHIVHTDQVQMLYQKGQRSLVYDLGYELAKEYIEEQGYELHTLPGEEELQGFDKYKRHFKVKQLPNKRLNLLADEPIEVWGLKTHHKSIKGSSLLALVARRCD